MNTIQSRLAICAATFVITLLSGLILSNSGKPYGTGIFTIHKLIAVGTIIVLVVSIRQLQEAADIHIFTPVLYISTGLLFLTLVVSGGLLSVVDANMVALDQTVIQAVLRVHQIVPLLAVAASVLSLYTLVASKA